MIFSHAKVANNDRKNLGQNPGIANPALKKAIP